MIGHNSFAKIFCLQQPKARFPIAMHREMKRVTKPMANMYAAAVRQAATQ